MRTNGLMADGLDQSGDEDGVSRICCAYVSAAAAACTRSSVMCAIPSNIQTRRWPHRIG